MEGLVYRIFLPKLNIYFQVTPFHSEGYYTKAYAGKFQNYYTDSYYLSVGKGKKLGEELFSSARTSSYCSCIVTRGGVYK